MVTPPAMLDAPGELACPPDRMAKWQHGESLPGSASVGALSDTRVEMATDTSWEVWGDTMQAGRTAAAWREKYDLRNATYVVLLGKETMAPSAADKAEH